jgi:molybdate transport system regulatory protein
MAGVRVSFRVDFSPDCAVGPGKIALLEHISCTGSLQPVAEMSVGGRGGGGASLTPFGADLVAAYRSLEAQIRRRAQTAFPSTALPAAGEAHSRKSVPKRRINRPTAPASRPRPKP